MTCGVYQLTAPSGNFYIGSSKNIEYRARQHQRDAMAGRHHSRTLTDAFKKYGDLDLKILLVCREEDRLFYEQFCLDALKPTYNNSSIAGKIEMTPAVRLKVAEANSRRVVSSETRARMSASRMGNKNATGSKRTEAGMRAYKEKRKGWKPALGHRHTAEVRARMSAAGIARWAKRRAENVD